MSRKQEISNALMTIGLAIVGAVGSSLLVNYTPGLNTAKPVWRSVGQGLLGIGFTVFLPGKFHKLRAISMGAGLAGGLGAFERATGVKTMAGDPGGALSPVELAMLRMNGALPPRMNGLVTLNRNNAQRLSGLVDLNQKNRMQPGMAAAGFRAPY